MTTAAWNFESFSSFPIFVPYAMGWFIDGCKAISSPTIIEILLSQ
eukprot:CAMPEP_0201602500 /NCGR_PEP_ID=MMETSP0492-20130828/3209_1 /ASSEMBLY_ACC=CAM_ASM_000837 /TAXON_ID=420259 /ORGANISM="Thalassiosira gravida, Strain GMp14c1" /LENGTH=44 /DNA_ID= /DNA_START= /DNA_END= /DNA_ORIENTATION=